MPPTSSVSRRAGIPGWQRPSFRDALALILGGLRRHGWVWRLAMLWAVLGAGGALYGLVCATVGCTTRWCTDEEFWFVLWNGQPGVIVFLANLAETIWPLLTVIVLVAGFVRLRGWRRRNWLRAAAWTGVWVAGIALIVPLAVVAAYGSEAPNLSWGAPELPILAAWLALGVWVNRILSRPAKPSGPPQAASGSDESLSQGWKATD